MQPDKPTPPISTSPQSPAEYPPAIFPARLEWLCQPAQIEHTLRLLYYLNSWRNAHERILYPDRQGLQETQALILSHATRTGIVQAVAYLDGTSRFPGELLLEKAAHRAAEEVLTYVGGLCDPAIWPPFYEGGSETYKHFIRPFLKRITGKDCKLVGDALKVLNLEQVRGYIQEELQHLVERARATREPIQLNSLAALCIAPVDLLHIRDNRVNFLDGYDTWEDLDITDLLKLHPEGYSQIALQYTSPTAEYVFHIPFWQAIKFVPEEQIGALKSAPGLSQERGIVRGKALDKAESLEYLAREILQDLGVNIARVCPYKLRDKQLFLANPSIRQLLWPTDSDEDWSNDPWDGICLPLDPLYHPELLS